MKMTLDASEDMANFFGPLALGTDVYWAQVVPIIHNHNGHMSSDFSEEFL